MSATREINLDTITPLIPTPTNDTVVATDTIATTVVADTSSPQPAVQSQDNGCSSWIAWIAIGVAIGVGIWVWKLINNLKKEIKILSKGFTVAKEKDDKLLMRVERLSDEIDVLNQKIVNLKLKAATRVGEVNNPSTSTQYEQKSQSKQKNAAVQIRYATLQSPDENGVLRFSERSMTESASPQKMFLMEINPASGTGTYRINPNALDLILGDLQMFSDFVKPFTFSGNPKSANIRDKKVGKITKQGNFWVVEEPLEISIH